MTIHFSTHTPSARYHVSGWPQSRRKNSLNFPGLSRAINLLFHRLSQQKVNLIITFIKGHDDPVYRISSRFTQIFEWRTKNTFCYNFSWGCTEFPDFSIFREILSIPGFPGLWPPCISLSCYFIWLAWVILWMALMLMLWTIYSSHIAVTVYTGYSLAL